MCWRLDVRIPWKREPTGWREMLGLLVSTFEGTRRIPYQVPSMWWVVEVLWCEELRWLRRRCCGLLRRVILRVRQEMLRVDGSRCRAMPVRVWGLWCWM